MAPNRRERIPRRTRCWATDHALHTTMASLRTNYGRTICYQSSVVTAKNATHNYICWGGHNIRYHLSSSGVLWMFTSMQCFKCRLTNSSPVYKIHLENTNQLVMQKTVEKMKKSRTAANRTCRPLEVGAPLRLVDVFTRHRGSWIKLTALWIRWQL